MNSFLSKLEDRILDSILWLFAPFAKGKTANNSVRLYFFTGFEWALLASIAIGTGTSAVIARKNRKSQERMAKKQLQQQKRESAAILEAQETTRTPVAPKNQQLPIQGTPRKAKKRSDLSISGRGSRRGKGSLRVGASGNYGARVT
mgnify:CR=1 FL=1